MKAATPVTPQAAVAGAVHLTTRSEERTAEVEVARTQARVTKAEVEAAAEVITEAGVVTSLALEEDRAAAEARAISPLQLGARRLQDQAKPLAIRQTWITQDQQD